MSPSTNNEPRRPAKPRKTQPKPAPKPAPKPVVAPVLAADPTVGQILKGTRVAQDLTLKQVEQTTKVRGKYLIALESDDYDSLPHNVYTRGFVQSYATMLGLDAPALARQHAKERGHQQQQLKSIRALRGPRVALTPRLLTLVGSSILGVLAAGYLVWQLTILAAPPRLEVTNPSKDQVLYGSLITISGHVAGGADVFVNDSPILVDGNGNYTDAIALQDGVNSITVSAKNRLGKTSVVTRSILAHVPKTDASAALPTAPFDGVAVSVQVQSKAATVTVMADGKQRFKGTMLPGTMQTFKGSNSITVSTSNAAATNVTVTNATTASKNLGALGSDNHAKNGFQFDKDTQFQ